MTDSPLEVGVDRLKVERDRLSVQHSPSGTGYDAEFLGAEGSGPTVSPPRLGPAVNDPVRWQGRTSLPYQHFSVCLSSQRRLARWVAWNIDQPTLRDGDSVSRSGLRFTADPRIPAADQTLEDVYRGNRLDRGHLARRADLLWGDDDAARRANRDSFCFTNIAPQMDSFNQSGQEGAWGMLENSLLEYLHDTPVPRCCVMAGPVLRDDDPAYRGVQVPLEFWKLLIYRDDAGALTARAFVVTQNLDGLETITLDEQYRTYGVPLTDVESRTGLDFSATLHTAALTRQGVRPDPHQIHDAAAIRW